MDILFNSIRSVMLIVLLIAAGYFFAAKGWMGEREKKFLSSYLMKLAIPCTCISSLRTYLTHDMLRGAGVMLLIPTICNTVCFLLSYIPARLLKLPRKSMGVFMFVCALPNSLFIGYPLCIELFGEAATPYIMFYYIICSLFTQLVGMSLIRWSAEGSIRILPLLGKIFTSPTVLGSLFGVAMVVFDFSLPGLLMSFIKYTGQTVTPLALMVSGQIICSIGLKSVKIDRVMAVGMAFRFLISPCVCALLCALFGVEGFPRSVFIVMSALPVVTQTAVGAAEYGADETIAARGIAVSTLLSFAFIPVLTVIIEHI